MKSRESQHDFDPMNNIRCEWIEEALNEDKSHEKSTRCINIKKIASIAACIAVLVMGATCILHAQEITEAIKSLFVREQELVNPYAIINNNDEAVTENNSDHSEISMTIDRIYRDGDYFYINANIHKPSGFDCDFLSYESMNIYRGDEKHMQSIIVTNAHPPKEAWISAEKWGTNDPNEAAQKNIKIHGKFVSETDFEATIILWSCAFGGEIKFYPEDQSFVIKNLIEVKCSSDDDTDQEKTYETVNTTEILVGGFEVGKEGFPKIPAKTIALDKEFEVDGYKFVVEEMTISPMAIEVLITDKLHQVINLNVDSIPEPVPFDALGMICRTDMICHLYTKTCEDIDAENEMLSTVYDSIIENNIAVYESRYLIAIELSDDAKVYWDRTQQDISTRYIHNNKDDDGNYYVESISVRMRAEFTAPVYEDEILSVGFFKKDSEKEHLESYGHKPDIEIWRNDAE